MPSLIEITDLHFSYGSDPALCGVNLAVEAGTTLGLIGPNGGGKTTLVKLLLGLLKPQSGRITLAGLEPSRAVRRGDLIGYLPQNPQIATSFAINVRQLVRLGLAGKTGLLRAYDRATLEFVESLIERIGLTAIADKPISEISGGQLQRALIARALAPKPQILVLDEPTTGIDTRGQRDFVELVHQLKTELGLTLIFVSHDLRAVTSISDRVACLNMHLHYHDTPRHLPTELVFNMFACDLEAMGIGDAQATTCCSHGNTNDESADKSSDFVIRA